VRLGDNTASSSRFGGFLLGIGAAVGIAAVVGLATGFEPSRLPAALLDVAVYKLPFAAAGEPLAARPALPDATDADVPQPGAPRPKVEGPKRT
jgi:hypothetical protein